MKPRMTCCRYSELYAEDLEASAQFSRAIRERLDPDKLTELMLDALRSAASKRAHRDLAKAATMLLERLPASRDLRFQLALELELARRELDRKATEAK